MTSAFETTARAVAELDRHGTPSHEVYTAGFYASDWDFEVRSLLGKASRGGADAGEVLATIAAIAPGDHDGWLAGWTRLGARVATVAAASAARGHRVSAERAFLRASNYLAVAANAVTGAENPDQLRSTFRAQQAAWEGFASVTAWPVERLDLPYDGTSLPAWLFHPDASDRARPTLVVDNGSNGSHAGAWCGCAEGGLARGYNVLLFDGPGQQSMLFERGVPSRHDWEKVLTPVVDFLLTRDDVDPTKLAVYGGSQAGCRVPRALAFEHRFAAAIADGGVVDGSRSWFAHLPPLLRSLYDHGATERFDDLIAARLHASGGEAARWTWRSRARPYGASGYADVLRAVSHYTVADIAGRITTPLYVTDPDGEQFAPGQPAELVDLVPGATLARFRQEEGASYHCQPLARELTEQRMFDWLDEQLIGSGRR